MGSIYEKNGRLYLQFLGSDGVRVQKAAGLAIGDERKAKRMLEKLETRIAAEAKAAGSADGPLTVTRYLATWIADRRERGVASADDDHGRIARHALPFIGALLLSDVRPRHVRDLVRELRKRMGSGKDKMAPRSVRHVYGILHTMFRDAVCEELIDVNPCALKRDELPKKLDKVPGWRGTAIFTRDEVETLISDERIPMDRRVLYAVLFFGGLRFGEAAALRWRAYDSATKPLGALDIHASYNIKTKKEKSAKTGVSRRVPVHPVLAGMLATWKLKGCGELLGHSPKPDDLVIPSRRGVNRSVTHGRYKLHQDLARVGLRARRLHDLRRTFITVALADGARKDILRWVTHGREGDIIDLYTTLPWKTLADEVAKLKIVRRQNEVIALPLKKVATAAGQDLLPPLLPSAISLVPPMKSAEAHGNRTHHAAARAEHHRF